MTASECWDFRSDTQACRFVPTAPPAYGRRCSTWHRKGADTIRKRRLRICSTRKQAHNCHTRCHVVVHGHISTGALSTTVSKRMAQRCKMSCCDPMTQSPKTQYPLFCFRGFSIWAAHRRAKTKDSLNRCTHHARLQVSLYRCIAALSKVETGLVLISAAALLCATTVVSQDGCTNPQRVRRVRYQVSDPQRCPG